ncbi:MAG: endonuclease/exonuclease/phosphatase family protein, partial [Candidatus Andersenbacteria bacterium]
GGRVQFGNAIFSKYPITSSSTVFYDMPYVKLHVDKTHGDHSFMPRNLQHGQIDINGTILHLFNTQGIWGFDGDDNQRRIKMAKTIVREVSDLSHTVLMGDFNVQERTKTAGIIEQALYPVFKDENRTTSFNLKRQTKSGYKTAVVDMMFTSQDVSVVEHHVSDADVSDHLALVTTIEL